MILDWIVPFLPENKPRHLLGIGSVYHIFQAVERGIDLFDCKIPTQEARHGYIYMRPPQGTRENYFRYDILKNTYSTDTRPLDERCACRVCTTYSRAYVSHLLRTKEFTGYSLASYHNVHFFLQLMRDIRRAIEESKFYELKKEWGL